MDWASLSAVPVTPDIPTHSLPARSTSCSLVLYEEQGEELTWRANEREVDEVDTFNGPLAVLYRPGEDIGELYIRIKCSINRSPIAMTFLLIEFYL